MVTIFTNVSILPCQVVHGYFTYMTMKVIITYKPMTATNMKLNKFTNETKIQRCGQVSPSKLWLPYLPMKTYHHGYLMDKWKHITM